MLKLAMQLGTRRCVSASSWGWRGSRRLLAGDQRFSYENLEISAKEFETRLKDANNVVIDVREPNELAMAKLNLESLVNLPMAQLVHRVETHDRMDVVDDIKSSLPSKARSFQASLIFLCHHGVRSRAAALLFRDMGWKNSVSVRGGLNAYSSEVDPSIPKY